MSDVTVVGLGAMGAALARTLLAKGHAVTVWNRTAGKGSPLVAAGAVQALTPRDAVMASPVTIVSVDDYASSRKVLDNTGDGLSGRVLVQLTSDTGTHADELGRWAEANDVAYIDGVILAYPNEIGGPDTALFVAGQASAWDRCESILLDLGGATAYLGENLRVPSMLSSALISPLMGMALGVVQGALLCESEDFPVSDFADLLVSFMPVVANQMQYLLTTIEEDRFDAPEASLKTYASSISDRTEENRQRGINAELYVFVDDLLSRCIAAGHGDEELSAVIKLWR
jgi:3-hydroxyisobutyrate dehydrogenase-like beta-hydroxyacid dehydrogenase